VSLTVDKIVDNLRPLTVNQGAVSIWFIVSQQG